MRSTGQAAHTANTGRTNDHRTLGMAGFTDPDSDGSLVTMLALVAAVNFLVLAVLYPLLAAVAVLGLAGGLVVTRYATRSDKPRLRGRRRSGGTPRPR